MTVHLLPVPVPFLVVCLPFCARWAIGMSHLRSTSHTLGDADFPYIYKKGPAFGMPGVRVDGMDVLKVGSHGFYYRYINGIVQLC
jgi:TPP-dependent pyruvate/acetoin dehydrogenase alpha subunit